MSKGAIRFMRNIHLLPQNKNLVSLHTHIRNKTCSQRDFIFYSKRIIALLLEKALDFLPYENIETETPLEKNFSGLKLKHQEVCGVSILRAGESMEDVLREILPEIPFGKILIQRNYEKIQNGTGPLYSSFPSHLSKCHVLLLDPILATGNTAISSLDLLREKGVSQEKIIFVNLICAPEGIERVFQKFPKITLVTSSIDDKLDEKGYIIPGIGDFGDRFLGT